MARKPRIHYPGAFYHVMLRGNCGADIFFDDDDRYRFYLLLQQCTERYNCRVHSFCLMDNHIHLAMQVGTIPLSRIMQNLSFRYTRWINWRRKQVGHLFQGRYKAIVIDLDCYLMQLTSYLHLNPVRAGIVEDAEDYPWSSHRAYLGKESIPWLCVESVLSQLSSRVDRARQLFDEFVADRVDEGHRKEFHGKGCFDSRVFGDDAFMDQAMREADQTPLQRPGLALVITAVEGSFGVSDAELLKPGQGLHISEIRALTAWGVLELSGSTLQELGQWLDRDVSSLSSAVRRLRERAAKDPGVALKMEQLRKALSKFATLQA